MPVQPQCKHGNQTCTAIQDYMPPNESESKILIFKILIICVLNTSKYTQGELTCLPQSIFNLRWQERVTVKLKDQQCQWGLFTSRLWFGRLMGDLKQNEAGAQKSEYQREVRMHALRSGVPSMGSIEQFNAHAPANTRRSQAYHLRAFSGQCA